MGNEIDHTFGNVLAQASFVERHCDFLSLMEQLKRTCEAADTVGPMHRDDLVMYSLVRLVIEDFNEVILLAANGTTTGAMKILRGMFERVVTVCYLETHSEQIDLFVDYWAVSERRSANRIREDMPNALPEKVIQYIESEYDKVEKKFATKGGRKPRMSWNDLDIISLAKNAGGFDSLIHICYYEPLSETHPSMGAVLRRAAVDSDDSYWYEYGIKPRDEWLTLRGATYLLLRALEVFQRRFESNGLAELINQCLTGFREWLEADKAHFPEKAETLER
jgi:Family of unknown function (DUF5677)